MTVYWKTWPLKGGKSGGAWYMRRMVDGVSVDERAKNPDNPKQKANTKKEAEYFESIVNQRLCQGEPVFKPKPTPWTFERFVEEKYRPIAEANHRGYKNGAKAFLKVLIPEFGARLISEIGPVEIEAFKRRQQSRKKQKGGEGDTLKPKTVNSYINCLSGVFTLAVAEKLRMDNPCDSVMRLEVEPITKRVLSDEDEERLLVACENVKKVNRWDRRYLAHAIVIMVEGGFRPLEFLTMKKSQVNLSTRQVTVLSYKRGWKRRVSAQPKRRVVPISDRALPYYQVMMESEGDQLYPYDSVKKSWMALCKEVGLDGFWFRWLRDTAKHRWELAGFGPFEIAKLMGHSSPVMTMEYSIVEQERALTLMNRRGNAPVSMELSLSQMYKL